MGTNHATCNEEMVSNVQKVLTNLSRADIYRILKHQEDE